jgi:GMP synthase-like glutamine amidotransferase
MLKVWMSHGDKVTELPHGFKLMASTPSCPIAGMADEDRRFYGVQFHPEVTIEGFRRWQAAPLQARLRGIELGLRHAPHIGQRQLTLAFGLERFGVFFGRIGQKQFMAHADLLEQLPAAWALRGEVDEVVRLRFDGSLHSRW